MRPMGPNQAARIRRVKELRVEAGDAAAHQRAVRQALHALGICPDCGADTTGGELHRSTCKEGITGAAT